MQIDYSVRGDGQASDLFMRIPEEKRRRIINVAVREFAGHGFTGANVNRIARGAGISVGALYKYFPSKERLFMHIVEVAAAGLDRYVREIIEADIRLRPAVSYDAPVDEHIVGIDVCQGPPVAVQRGRPYPDLHLPAGQELFEMLPALSAERLFLRIGRVHLGCIDAYEPDIPPVVDPDRVAVVDLGHLMDIEASGPAEQEHEEYGHEDHQGPAHVISHNRSAPSPSEKSACSPRFLSRRSA